MKAKRMGSRCKCVDEANKALKPRHTHVVTTVFSGMVGIRTELNYDAPKRTRAVSLIATFCPFCGVRYVGTVETDGRKLMPVPEAEG
jgi:hypothetical protein